MIVICSSCYSSHPKDSTKRSSTTNGISLEIAMPASVRAGQPIEMVLELTNTSPRAIFFGQIDGVHELGIHVLDSKKATPELTPLGKDRLLGNPNKYNTQTLLPNQSREWHVELNTLFKLVPGTYLVSASIELNRQLYPFVVSVDGVKIKIL